MLFSFFLTLNLLEFANREKRFPLHMSLIFKIVTNTYTQGRCMGVKS